MIMKNHHYYYVKDVKIAVKPSQGFTWVQEWFLSASLAQGLGSRRDKLGITAQSSRVLGIL
ncbi:hypothetical protein H5410_021303 [Solanum commersonii]|uniref:Uncharacterized protein n=1 Tax=Solanum commersonii TaxID=4109 RepID=A0A9J5ZGS5_SOLCO|nr:hypothetical protein H5410_021303 [Solanum commersonii]